MGIRPSVSLVFGTEGEFYTEDWEDNVILPNVDTSTLDFDDNEAIRKFFVMKELDGKDLSCVYSSNGIVGYEIESRYNDYILWVVQALCDRFQTSGFINIPSSLEYRRLQYLHAAIKTAKDNNKSIPLSNFRKVYKKNPDLWTLRRHEKNKWLYPIGVDYSTIELWADTAIHLFDTYNIPYKVKDLRLMLCWNWG